MRTFNDIREALQGVPIQTLNDPHRSRSAVAMILRECAGNPHLLFIRRASHPDDPWSGDLAFPGGRIEPDDLSAQAAAEREVREEIGLDLQQAQRLGQLDDLVGAHLPVVVSCFVYQTHNPVTLTLNHEVAQFFWIPLTQVADVRRHRPAVVSFNGQSFIRPAINLLGPGHPVLWGITYRLVMNFLERLGCHSGIPQSSGLATHELPHD